MQKLDTVTLRFGCPIRSQCLLDYQHRSIRQYTKGALAFLVVISKGAATENSADLSENAQINKTSVFTRRRSGVRIAPGPSFFLQSDTLETSIGAFSDTRIMAKKKHNKDKKLYNFDEKLHNSNELDLTWQEEVDLQPEDEVEGGSEIYYFTDEDGNIPV